MIETFEHVLVLAPHTDDGEFGCGGTIARLREAGAQVTYAVFSVCRESVPEGFPKDTLATEVRSAVTALGIGADDLKIYDYPVRQFDSHRQAILEDLVTLRARRSFDLVLIPSLNDVHQDHGVVAREARRAFKMTTMLGYEMPWNMFRNECNCYVHLSARHMELKLASIACYETQRNRPYASPDAIHALARVRGVQCGAAGVAEAFEVVRLMLR